jgi:arsenite methyltransferase
MTDSSMLPSWFVELLLVDNSPAALQGGQVDKGFVVTDGILRSTQVVSAAQKQTEEAFGFKWAKRDTFDSPTFLAMARSWLVERYGRLEEMEWFRKLSRPAIVLDAGCGAGMSALEYFGPALDRIHYIGADISTAVDVARSRFTERGFGGAFVQADLTNLPLRLGTLDIVFSEGVLHHTDSTAGAIMALAPLLRTDGHFMFYVYRRKGPIREFVDDLIRCKLQEMTPQRGWDAMMPLTRLGEVLGKLDIEIDIPEPIEILEIPAGRTNLQRFFYWHFAKAFYRPDITIEEMNHINFDWYAPRNAHRQSIDEVRAWCSAAGLAIEHEKVEEAGITIIARRLP